MASTPTIPHLAEAFSLAQFLAADRQAAEDVVVRAFADARRSDRGRFSLLRAVVRASGVGRDPVSLSGADHADDSEERQEAPGESLEPSGATFVPLVGARAGSVIRDRLLPTVLGSLDGRDRAVAWLLASGLSSPSDAASILDAPADRTASWIDGAEGAIRRRLVQAAALHERPLLAVADRHEPLRDALRRAVTLLAEPPPATLVRRLRPASGRSGPAPRRDQAPTRRVLLIITMIVAMAAVGYAIQSLRPAPGPAPRPAVDAIRGAMATAAGVGPDFRTASAEQVELFIRDRLGWNVVIPAISGRPVTGVGITQIVPDMEIPVLIYGGAPQEPVRVVVYTYAFLDRAEPGLTLDDDTRRQIAEPGRFSVLDAGDERALVFRNRDDIFVAVTSDDTAALQDAIRFPG